MTRKQVWEQADRYLDIYPKKYVVAYEQVDESGVLAGQETRGRVQGAGVDDVLDYVNIGMHLANSSAVLGPLWLNVFDFSNSRVKSSYVRRSWNEMQRPFLGAFRISSPSAPANEAADDSDELERAFASLDLFLRKETSLKCDTSDHWKGDRAWGKLYPDLQHHRWFFCDPDLVAPINTRERGDAMVLAQRIGKQSGMIGAAQPGDLVAYAVVSGLSGLPGWEDRSAAVRLFEQVRNRIPPDAHTVFTGLDEAGEWKVFVAKGDQVLAFDSPPKP